MIDLPVYRFARFELSPHRHQLTVDGQPVTLGSRALEVLEALASRPGHLLTKQELLDRVWPDAAVQEVNLAMQISALRKVLGPEIIATIPGRGYRLIAAAGPAPGVAARSAPPALTDGAAEPPSASPAAPPKLRTNLPPWTRPLLGREADVAALAALMRRHRIVTITGGGGMGKTLLAHHLLLAPLRAHRHGVCWVELAAVSDAAALPGAVASAMGLDVAGGDAAALLAAAVAPLDMLLALDNAEHLLADVAALAQQLHDAAPGLRLVVTSQAPLRLPAESVYRLAPLTVPPPTLTLGQAMEYGAIALLAERALACDARFVLTDELVPALVEVCRALDGVPLAIELAAARAPLLGLPQLAQSLRDRLRLLSVNNNRWAPPRQRTLREALDWSYGLLTEPDQRVFRRLGVLAGSASLPTLQALASDGVPQPADAWSALDSLTLLVDRSLIVLLRADDADAAAEASPPPRYRLLESSRLFALEQLQRHGEAAATRRVHGLHMADLCDAAWNTRWSGEIGISAWRNAIEPDVQDALEAFAWAAANGQPAPALRIARTLLYALPPSQQRHRVRLAEYRELQASEGSGDPARAGAGTALPDGGLPLAERLQSWLAVCSQWIDVRWTRAWAAAEQALLLAREHAAAGGDPFWLYTVLSQRATLQARRGDVAAARATLAEMQALGRASGQTGWPPQRLLVGVSAENFVARAAGEPAAALAIERQRLSLRRAAGADVLLSLANLMDAEVAAGEAAAAVRTGGDLVRQLDGSRDQHNLSTARLNMLAAWLALGDLQQARSLVPLVWVSACRFGQQAYCADYLALLAALQARHEAAARLAGYATHAYRARDSVRDGNEAVAFQRAAALATGALGAAAVAALMAQGQTLGEEDVARLALPD